MIAAATASEQVRLHPIRARGRDRCRDSPLAPRRLGRCSRRDGSECDAKKAHVLRTRRVKWAIARVSRTVSRAAEKASSVVARGAVVGPAPHRPVHSATAHRAPRGNVPAARGAGAACAQGRAASTWRSGGCSVAPRKGRLLGAGSPRFARKGRLLAARCHTLPIGVAPSSLARKGRHATPQRAAADRHAPPRAAATSVLTPLGGLPVRNVNVTITTCQRADRLPGRPPAPAVARRGCRMWRGWRRSR